MSATTTSTSTASTSTGQTVPELGTTTIERDVVAKVAGIAARDVAGVHALGGAARRAIGAVRDAMNTTDLSQGIAVTITDDTVSVDATLSAEYPIGLQKVASDVRSAVVLAVETIVGLEVTAVNVTINDVFTPEQRTHAEPE